MAQRRIDMSYLVWAWQDDSPDNSYYLDKRTGDVRLVNQHLLDLRQLTDEIEKNRERYLYLPKPDKQNLLADLHDFAQSVGEQKTRSVLAVAFESPHVLSAFRKILDSQPEELHRLNEYIESKVRKRIAAWMNANKLEESWQDGEEEEPEEEYDDWEDFSVPK
ncbi:MAG TPA: UPF0158 family protein [Planktothrix sp.]|jgi:hypothetical protein